MNLSFNHYSLDFLQNCCAVEAHHRTVFHSVITKVSSKSKLGSSFCNKKDPVLLDGCASITAVEYISCHHDEVSYFPVLKTRCFWQCICYRV